MDRVAVAPGQLILSFPRSSVRFRDKPKNRELKSVRIWATQTSIKGAKLLFQIIKAIIMIRDKNWREFFVRFSCPCDLYFLTVQRLCQLWPEDFVFAMFQFLSSISSIKSVNELQ